MIADWAFWRTLGVLLRAARTGEVVNEKKMIVRMRMVNLFIVDCVGAMSCAPAILLPNFILLFNQYFCKCKVFLCSGEGGIRTHGNLTVTSAFQANALDHYATSPAPLILS